MDLITDDVQSIPEGMLEKMKEALEAALKREGIAGENGQVSLTLAEPEEIRELNRAYRGKDSVTDVLSFPQYDDVSDIPKTGPFLLGDVVINPERAGEQAEEYGHSFEREMVYLFTHSIFHLLGYDHMDEEEKSGMRRAEEDVMRRIGLERK